MNLVGRTILLTGIHPYRGSTARVVGTSRLKGTKELVYTLEILLNDRLEKSYSDRASLEVIKN